MTIILLNTYLGIVGRNFNFRTRNILKIKFAFIFGSIGKFPLLNMLQYTITLFFFSSLFSLHFGSGSAHVAVIILLRTCPFVKHLNGLKFSLTEIFKSLLHSVITLSYMMSLLILQFLETLCDKVFDVERFESSTLCLFIRTSKLCFRLAVLNFFSFLRLKWS